MTMHERLADTIDLCEQLDGLERAAEDYLETAYEQAMDGYHGAADWHAARFNEVSEAASATHAYLESCELRV